MTEAPTASRSSTTSTPAVNSSTLTRTSTGGSALVTDDGNTTIADAVVAKIVGIAAREVPGVHALGGSASRAFGSVRGALGGGDGNLSQGVKVEVGERQAAADLDVVVDYGFAIVDVAGGVRRNVIGTVERMTGLQVTEVNINVNDIHLPGEESEEPDTRERRRVE